LTLAGGSASVSFRSQPPQEARVPYLLIRCQVENAATWAPIVADQMSLLRASGVQSIKFFANSVDPHEILGLFEWDDLDRARLFSRSDELPDLLGRAGVVEQPDLWFLQETDSDLFGVR
jgi:hypothetical protein